MSRQANCERIRRVLRTLVSLGCDDQRIRHMSISEIARKARVEPEEAKTAIKTIRRRGWLETQYPNHLGAFYKFKEEPSELIMKTRQQENVKPTHLDAVIAAGFLAEEELAELKKCLKSLREPKGSTVHQIAEKALQHKDNVERILDKLSAHAANHCGLEGQGDIVDEANKAAKAAAEAEARKEADVLDVEADVLDVEAEPLFGDEDEDSLDGTVESLPGSPLGLEWSDGEDEEEDEGDDDDEDDFEGADQSDDEQGAA